MYQVIIVIHVLLGLGVVGLILMQQGKGADAGAAFGSGGSGSVFGAQGAASFLSRSTAILATLFFTTSLTLAVLNSQKGEATDLLTAPKAQETIIPGLAEPKAVEDIPAQAQPAAVAPAPAIESAPLAAPTEEPSAKPAEPEETAQPKEAEKPASDVTPKAAAPKPKAEKKVKKADAKKSEAKKAN